MKCKLLSSGWWRLGYLGLHTKYSFSVIYEYEFAFLSFLLWILTQFSGHCCVFSLDMFSTLVICLLLSVYCLDVCMLFT